MYTKQPTSIAGGCPQVLGLLGHSQGCDPCPATARQKAHAAEGGECCNVGSFGFLVADDSNEALKRP